MSDDGLPLYYPLALKLGCSYDSRPIAWMEGSSLAGAQPADLTAATALLEVAAAVGAPSIMTVTDVASSLGQVQFQSGGTWILHFEQLASAALMSAVYRLRITRGARVQEVMRGPFVVSAA